MKKLRFLSWFFFVSMMMVSFIACDKNDDNGDGGNGGGGDDTENPILFENGTQIGNGDKAFDIIGKHTLKKGTYVLKGWCYVTAGSELTIEAGTVIKGDKGTMASLIVEPGGKVFAKGTESNPIVFTSNQPAGSRKPGDWGGLVVCGKAPNNNTKMTIEGGLRTEHGGNDVNDNSGIFSYIRVEFAGYPFGTDQEINGVTFGSVGKGTQVDHIQVSYSNDDSFEWFGGTVDGKYLVAYHGWDDEFDTDNGFSGNLQFLLSVRHPRIADTSLSNGFESDNNKDGTASLPFTGCVFSNVTFVGPIGQADDFSNTTDYINAGNLNPQNGSKLGTYQAAMQIRRNSQLNCFNSVAIGYPVGLLLDNQKGTTQTWATEGKLKLNNLYFAGMTILGSDVNKAWKDAYSTDGVTMDESKKSFSHTFFLAQTGNKYYENISDLMLNQPNSLKSAPNYGPKAGSPLCNKNTESLFADVKLQNSFFQKVNYVGAFKSDADQDNWLRNWTNFDPQNTVY